VELLRDSSECLRAWLRENLQDDEGTLPKKKVSLRDESKLSEILGLEIKTLRKCLAILSCPDKINWEFMNEGALSVDEKHLRVGKDGIKESVLSGDLTIDEAYQKVRYYASKLKDVRERMIEKLGEGEPINVPQYWFSEGWWPPTAKEMRDVLEHAKQNDKAKPLSVVIPDHLRVKLEKLEGAAQSHVIQAVKEYLAGLEPQENVDTDDPSTAP
jgi:hypothetical protein